MLKKTEWRSELSFANWSDVIKMEDAVLKVTPQNVNNSSTEDKTWEII